MENVSGIQTQKITVYSNNYKNMMYSKVYIGYPPFTLLTLRQSLYRIPTIYTLDPEAKFI
jgi:hypothetical protein